MLVILALIVLQTILFLALLRYRHPGGPACRCSTCQAHRERNGWT